MQTSEKEQIRAEFAAALSDEAPAARLEQLLKSGILPELPVKTETELATMDDVPARPLCRWF